MAETKRMTALNASVGADARQSPNAISISSISDLNPDCNTSEKKSKGGRDLSRVFDPGYLRTISMSELYETVYESKLPLIDGFLYPGTYLFVGAPKLGKSFLMAQLAYHISTGTPLWDMPTKKGTVLYLALEDDYGRLQKRLYRMFGTESTENLYFSVSAKQLGCGLDEQLGNFINEHPDTVLIIIDTLQKVREIGGDGYSYASDYDIIARLKQLSELKKDLDNSPDYALPEPQRLMSAKSYKAKFVDPLIKKLKELVMTVFARYLKAIDDYHRVQNVNNRYYRENQRLLQDNEYLRTENKDLKDANQLLRSENKDYAFLWKMFGRERIDNLMKEARELQEKQRKRKRSHER